MNTGSAIFHKRKTATLAITNPKTMSLLDNLPNHDLLQTEDLSYSQKGSCMYFIKRQIWYKAKLQNLLLCLEVFFLKSSILKEYLFCSSIEEAS